MNMNRVFYWLCSAVLNCRHACERTRRMVERAVAHAKAMLAMVGA